jgi:PAS domain S-box-containing protein
MNDGGLTGVMHMKKATRPEKTNDARDELSTLRRRVAEIEESVKWHKERYECLYEGCIDGYASIGLEGFFMESNSAFKKMIGYSGDELKGMTYRDVTPAKWHVMEEEILREQVHTGCYSRIFEKEFQRKDGTVFPAMLRTYLINDRDGSCCGIWGFIRDITDGKRAEEELKESEERFAKAFRSSPAPTYISGIDDGRYLDVNDSGLRLLGYTREEMVGHTAHELSIWVDSGVRDSAISRLRKQGRIQDELTRFRTKTGAIKETLWSCEVIKLNNEDVMLSLLYDVTESKRDKENLLKSEKKFASLFHLNPNPMSITDIDTGIFIDVNKACSIWTGYPREKLIGASANDLKLWVNPHDRENIIGALKADAELDVQEYMIRLKNGQIRNVLFSARIIEIDQEKYLLSLLHDITGRKQAEEALRETLQLFFDIIDFLPDATFAVDLLGKIIAWNRAVEDLTGVKKEDMLGKGNYEYALPFYNKRRPILVDLVLSSNKKIERNYDVFTKEQGRVILAETTLSIRGRKVFIGGKASPLYDSKGEIVGAIESVRDITDRKQYEDAIKKREAELEAKTYELEDMNSALRVLLKQREYDRKRFEEEILTNMKVLVSPYLEKLKAQLPAGKNPDHIRVLETNLKEIVSPFVRTLSTTYSGLTNREIQIANLIREEKTTKEIANLLNISESAVNVNRYRIRRKLKMARQNNLRMYLAGLG